MDEYFLNFFKQPGFIIKNIKDSDLDIYREVVKKVKAQHKESRITIEYKVETKDLYVNGSTLDYYYFGYYTKELE